jgi:hypothetical protein
MAEKPTKQQSKTMNDLLRSARGIELPEPKSEREAKEQRDEMNARLKAARGFTVEAKPDEEEE